MLEVSLTEQVWGGPGGVRRSNPGWTAGRTALLARLVLQAGGVGRAGRSELSGL